MAPEPAGSICAWSAGTRALSFVLTLLATGITQATNLPPGFVETVVVSIPYPENFAQIDWAPDGTLFIGDKPNKVYAWMDRGDPAGTFELRLIAQLQTNAEGERGVNGLAVDPDYLINRHIWIYYTTRAPSRNRVSRFTFDGELLTDETIMLEGPDTVQTDHNAGCLRFASDKTLFIAMGDDFQGSATAQNPFDLRGKILHINRDGTPASDNPFLDGVDGDPRVWAMGLRNPYRISIQPGTDNVFIGDVGNAAWEELNIGFPGANFGWAHLEGPTPEGRPFVYPIYAYNHHGAGAAIIGGDHADAGDFAPEYEGDYFFADFVKNELFRMILDEGNHVQDVRLFATEFGRVTDMQFGPDGALYYVCRSCGPASVRRVAYAGDGNRQPVAVASATPTGGLAPLAVQFDGSASSDADEDPLSFQWDFGDGTTADEMSPVHPYAQGVYDAQLTVTDDQGATGSAAAIRIVSGNTPPVAILGGPRDETFYRGGQEIAYWGSARDLEDGELSCSDLTWQVLFHHNTHSHPFLGPIQGSCGGTFVTPLIGERDPDQWYQLRLTARDSGAPLGDAGELTALHAVELRPRLAEMSFRTSPLTDLTLTLDTVPFTAPSTITGVMGMLRDVGAPEPQLGADGRWYRWLSWSDGGAPQHTLATPAADTTFTAHFACIPHALTNLRVEPDGDELVLDWDQGALDCLAGGSDRYRIYATAIVRPASGSGTFPVDPAYRLVGTTSDTTFRHAPLPEDIYFVVVGANAEGQVGQSGHYGF